MNTHKIPKRPGPAALATTIGLLLAAAAAAAPLNPTPAMTVGTATVPTPESAAPAVALPPELASYDIGLVLGGQIAHDGLGKQVSMDALMRGIKDAADGRIATPAEREAAMQYMHDSRDALAERNRQAARDFLEKNAKQPGIVALPSGLQYRVLVAGDPKGQSPGPTDQVTVRYRASLADGTEIDRSETHDRPASFRVNSVFKGWQEAFSQMKPGAKWQLFVPPELGYGKNSPPSIPPGALLIYDIELLQIQTAESMPLIRPAATPGSKQAAPAEKAPH